MQISEACIRRPVMTTLITASLIVFGAFAYRLLSVAALPAVDFPTIQITASLPGASPETMAASVAGPIERQLSTIAGITSMTSTSALGRSEERRVGKECRSGWARCAEKKKRDVQELYDGHDK